MTDNAPTSGESSAAQGLKLPRVELPSEDAAQEARNRQAILTKPAGALGRLEELSIWASSVQGTATGEHRHAHNAAAGRGAPVERAPPRRRCQLEE